MNYSKISNITQNWIKELKPFLRKYNDKLSATKVANLTKEPQQSVSRKLNELANLNLLEYEIEGRNKLFYINLEKSTSSVLLNLLENERNLNFQLEKKEISLIVNEILKYSENVVVFGSYAKNKERTDSDLDLLILGKAEKQEIKKIKRKQSVEINEHYLNYSEFIKLLNKKSPLLLEIKKDHIIFGNISKVVDLLIKNARR